MNTETKENCLLLSHFLRWAANAVKQNRLPLFTSFLAGLLAYMFTFTNKLINHDEAFCLFSKGATVTSGRWGLGLMDCIFPNISMPWIYGIITLVLICISACLIVRIFSVQNKLLQGLLASLTVVFPSLIGTYGYMFTSSSYGLSFFLAVVSVWLLQRKSRWLHLFALGSLIGSLSIYQSYISVAASLLVLVLIYRLLHEEDMPAILKTGIYYVSFLIAALGCYYIATQLVLALTGATFSNYAGSSITLHFSEIPASVILAYTAFFRFFTENFHALIPTGFSSILHLIAIGSGIMLLAASCYRQRFQFHARLWLLLLLIILLPLSINCMYLITSADSIHTLVLYSFIAVYILLTILADANLTPSGRGRILTLLRHTALNLLTLALALIIVCNIYIANAASLNLYLRYENAYAFFTSLAADLRMTPGFEESTQVAIIGEYNQPEFYDEQFAFTHDLTGIYGFLPDQYSAERFLNYYLGLSISFASADETAALRQSQEFANMQVYPYYGSIQKIDDILVVKLSN